MIRHMLAEALLSASAAFFPLRLPHVPTAGPWVGVCGLPWRMPGGKREGPDAFMEGKALYSLRTCPPRHRWIWVLIVGGRWLILRLHFPKLVPGSQALKGCWKLTGCPLVAAVCITSSFRTCSFSPPTRGTGSWQLLAALVLPEALWCHLGWFCLGKMPTPQSNGNREPKGIKRPQEEDPRCQMVLSTP